MTDRLINDKRCTHCQTIKSYQFFNKNKLNKDGLSSWCKACNAEGARWSNSYNRALARDQKKGFDTCTKEEYTTVMNNICHYCQAMRASGVDRINNNKGHEINNILPCCRACNLAKSFIFSVQETEKHIGPAIANIWKERGL